MKKVKAHLAEKDPSRVEAFEKAAQDYAKKIVANFKDWEFYTGDKMDPDAMVVLLNYREDGTTPYLVYFKDGLKVEKVVWNPFTWSDANRNSKMFVIVLCLFYVVLPMEVVM